MATRNEKVAVDVKVTGERDLKGLGRAVDDVGDELKDTARDASHLDRELDRLERQVNDLNREFARTGDKGLLKQIRDAKRDIGPLAAVRRELDKIAAADAKMRRQADSDRLKRMLTPQRGGLSSRIGMDIPTDANSLLLYGGGAAALSLPLGATAGGAIVAGGALAGVGLGVAGAAKGSPAIGNAFASAVGAESARWQKASKAFEEPTLRAIKNIKRAVDEIPLEDILKNSAELVDPLSEGLAGFVKNFGEGVGKLVESAGPVIEVLGDELPRLGRSFESMFDEIGQGSEGGAEALEDVLHVVERILIGTGKVIHFFEDAYAAGVKFRKALPGDIWGDDEKKVIGFGKAIGGAKTETKALAQASEEAAKRVGMMNDEFDRLFGRVKDTRELARDYQEAIDDLTESFQENGRTLDIGTERGRANQQAIQDVIDSIAEQRQAAIDAGGGSVQATEAANAKYREQLGLLEKQLRMLGATPAQIAAIVGAYKQIPSDVWTTVHVRADLRSIANVEEQMAVRLGRRASGGPIKPGEMYLVGERGPELITPGANGYVHDAQTTASMFTPGTRMASAAQPITLRVVGNDRALVELIKRVVIVEGGGNVQAAFGR